MALEHAGIGIDFCVIRCDTDSVAQFFESDQGKVPDVSMAIAAGEI